jgi:nucleoside-diphosphate-sugar epimerase
MQRVLVTGATGLCGRPLVRELVASGHAVRALVRRTPAIPLANTELVTGDLSQTIDWPSLVEGMDAVVHLAAVTASDETAEADYDLINHRATDRLARAAKAAGVRQFLYVSSVSAQSGPAAARPLSEADEPRPQNAYGRSKLAGERAVRASGVPFTILRPVMIYGETPPGYLARLARLAATAFPLPFAAFRNRRSLLGIDNFVSAVLFVLRTPATKGETFLLADPAPISLPDIVTAFRRGMGRRPGAFWFPPAPLRRMVGGGNSELVVEPAKLVAAGWTAVADTPTLLAQAATADLVGACD